MTTKTIDSGITKRGNSFRFTVSMGFDNSGKQIRKYYTFTPPDGISERKAEKLAKEAYIDFKNRCKGLSNFNENMRFKELTEEYFKIYAPNQLKPITAFNYKNLVEYHFINELGNKKLKDISTALLTDFFNSHTTTDKSGNKKPLSAASSKKLFTIMQSILSFAVNQGIIKESPARNVILPKNKSTETIKRKFLTEEELPLFLAHFQDYSILNTITKLLLYTGMRSGELLGLQWSDIDFENRLIHVNHTLTDVNGSHFLTDPKTKGSKRIIVMSNTVYDLLTEHKTKQHELLFILGNAPHPEMVFTSITGNFKDRSALNTSFKKVLKGSEFEFMTLHCLRHSNATLLLNAGVDLKIVSEHLGHSDVGTTGNIYADVLNSSRRKTADIIELKLAK